MGSWARVGVWAATLLVVVAASRVVRADEVHVAVAANFGRTAQTLARAFEARTGHRVVPSVASSGQLYAQIVSGAPFDVFMSADADRPERLERKGLAVRGSRSTYARGRLALWTRRSDLVVEEGTGLSASVTLALADPRTAPYGQAARAYLEARGLWQTLREAGRVAVGASVTQAYQFAATGAADVAFVALSQCRNGAVPGHHWIVPTPPRALDQQAVVLERATHLQAAKAWLAFLAHDARARAIMEADGYEVP